MKRQLSYIILTLILILGLTGCGHKSDSKSDTVSSFDSYETSLSEIHKNSDSSESNNSSDESVINETTQIYTDNTSTEYTDSSIIESTSPAQADEVRSNDAPHTDNNTTSSSVKGTKGTTKETPRQSTTTTYAEHRTYRPIIIHDTTTTQPATTSTPQTTAAFVEKNTINVTISISCKAALNNPQLKPGITLPSDGIILNSTSIKINEGDTVYDAFKKACSDSGIKYEFTGTSARKSIYISSIGGLSQMDCGRYSGWKYNVNGIDSSVGCSMYNLSDGDSIEWYYTITL